MAPLLFFSLLALLACRPASASTTSARQLRAQLDAAGGAYEVGSARWVQRGEELMVQIEAGGELSRNLTLQRDRVAASFEHRMIVDGDGRVEARQEAVDCLYRSAGGDLASVCGGDLRATLRTSNGRVSVVPMGEGDENQVLVHRVGAAGADAPWRCEARHVQHVTEHVGESPATYESVLRGPDPHRALQNSGREKRYIKMVIVNDHARFEEHGDMTHVRSAEVLQHVQELLQDLNSLLRYELVLQIVGMVTFVHADPWATPRSDGSADADQNGVLERFTAWRAGLIEVDGLPAHGLAHLLSGLEFAGDVVGLANLNTLCSNSAGTGVVQASRFQLQTVATILAHELAHNLGSQHTDRASTGTLVPENCNDGEFIMDPDGIRQDEWSLCTAGWINMAFDGLKYPRGCIGSSCQYSPTYGSRYQRCADDPAPQTWTLEPMCGNGIREPGEACDCGENDCADLDPCCDGATCQLASTALCSSEDACCDPGTCEPRRKRDNFVCRPALDTSCDMEETCDGESAACPADAHEPTGTECGDDEEGSCFAGECMSHQAQCEAYQMDACPGADHNDDSDSCGRLLCQPRNSGSCVALNDDGGVLVLDGTPCGGPLDRGQTAGDRLVCSESTCARADSLTLPVSRTCSNGRLDEGETDVDCGGDCFPCLPGGVCASDDDCFSTEGQPAWCRKPDDPEDGPISGAPTAAPTASSLIFVPPPGDLECSDLHDDPDTCSSFSGCVYLEAFEKCRVTGLVPETNRGCRSQRQESTCVNWQWCDWNSVRDRCDQVVFASSAPTMAPTQLVAGVCQAISGGGSLGDSDEGSTSPFDDLWEAIKENRFVVITGGSAALLLGLLLASCICMRHCKPVSDAECQRRMSQGHTVAGAAPRSGSLAAATSFAATTTPVVPVVSTARPGGRRSSSGRRSLSRQNQGQQNQPQPQPQPQPPTVTPPIMTRPKPCVECGIHYGNPANVRSICNSCNAKRVQRLQSLSQTQIALENGGQPQQPQESRPPVRSARTGSARRSVVQPVVVTAQPVPSSTGIPSPRTPPTPSAPPAATVVPSAAHVAGHGAATLGVPAAASAPPVPMAEVMPSPSRNESTATAVDTSSETTAATETAPSTAPTVL